GDLVRPLDLRDGAVDCIFDQLFVAVATGERLIDLRDDASFGVVAVGVDRRDRADPSGSCPGAGARMIGRADALAAFNQRPDLAPGVEDGLEPLEQNSSPGRAMRLVVLPL